VASTIKIKRSGTAGNPSTLAAGELAYSYLLDNGSNGGDRLYIGTGTESVGNAANHEVIGGRYYTRLIDATVSAGTLTTNAKSIPILSSTGTIDKWYVGNLYFNNNTITNTDTNGNINLNPNGSGLVQIANTWTLPRSAGSSNYILKTNGTDTATWAEPKVYIGTTAIDLFNSSGDVTSLAVDISGKAGSSGTADNVAHALTAGTDISFDIGTTFDGSVAVTISDSSTLDSVTGRGSTTTNSITVGGLTINSGTHSYSLPSQDGSAGYYLQTDGAGNLTWTSIAQGSNWYLGNTELGTSSGSVTAVTGLTTLKGSTDDNNYVDLGRSDSGPAIGTYSTTAAVVIETYDGAYTHSWRFNADGSTTFNDHYTFPIYDGTAGYVLTTDGVGNVSWSATAATQIQADWNQLDTNALDYIKNKPTSITAFGVTDGSSGTVLVTDGAGSFTFSSTISGLTDVTIGDLEIHSGHTIENVGVPTDGDITLKPKGAGHISASNAWIRDVKDPEADQDVATKKYVDGIAQGIHTHISVRAATGSPLATITGDTATYDNGDNGVGATITLSTPLTMLDNYSLQNKDRILIKNEGDASGLGDYVNGIYTWATGGTVLTRATDFDQTSEISGGDFVYVTSGTVYGKTGWVQVNRTTAIGTGNAIVFNQFSGAGTYLAGDGLALTGNTFSVNVNSTGGIEISNNDLQLKSTIAGDGLTYASGVLSVGGTANRITVNADSIDIASTYVGQDSITTVSSTTGITSGLWKGTAIGAIYGGTGQTAYAKGDILYASDTNVLSKLTAGTFGQVLQINADGVPVWATLDGGSYS
jgi:hypothetical protein